MVCSMLDNPADLARCRCTCSTLNHAVKASRLRVNVRAGTSNRKGVCAAQSLQISSWADRRRLDSLFSRLLHGTLQSLKSARLVCSLHAVFMRA